MENVIQVNELMKNDSKTLFGYVGRSLETGKMKYYYLESEDNFDLLHEFDINNINNEYVLSCLHDCNFERPDFSSSLPEELEEFLPEILNKHTAYNLENSYPIDCIDKNRIGLSVQPLIYGRFRRTRPSPAQYNALKNIINLRTTKKEWEILSEEEKERQKNHLIHEVGHLKATRCFFTGDILNVQVGFDINQYDTNPIPLENGDIFHKIEQRLPKDIIQRQVEYILEEIMNDYDCYRAFTNFHRNYPRFGEQLDHLCDGKLLMDRYTERMDGYYDSMYQIIPNKDQATELLETIYSATYGTSREATEEKAKKMVKRYEDAKRRK